MVMSLLADGPLLLALEAARVMIASTHEWQSVCGEPAPTHRIYIDALPLADPGPDYSKEQLIALRPFAIIYNTTSGGLSLRAAAANFQNPLRRGVIECQFQVNVPADIAADPNAVGTWARRIAGRIAQTGSDDNPGIAELTMKNGYLPVMEIDVEAFERTDLKEQRQYGDAVIFGITLHWGRGR